MIPCKKTGELYAYIVEVQIYGNLKHVIMYRNVTQANKNLVKRNKAIFKISEELNSLKRERLSLLKKNSKLN